MLIVFFLLCAVCVCLPSPSWANSLHRLRFNHLSVNQGLPSTGVMTVYQTKNGYIWLGTSNGLSRFDGRHVHTFGSRPEDEKTLSHPRVLSLYEDENQNLWIGTRRGIDRLDLRNEVIERFPMPDSSEHQSYAVYGIAQADSDFLWLASASGLLKLDVKNRKIHHSTDVVTGRQFGQGEVRAMVADRKGGIWFSQGPKIFHLDHHETIVQILDYTSQSSAQILSQSEQSVRSLHLTKDGRLWAGLGGGVLSWQADADTGLMRPSVSSLQLRFPKVIVTAILQDHRGALWFATGEDKGLFRWREAEHSLEQFMHLPSVNTSLSGNSLTSLMMDSAGSLWIGSSDYGVNLVDLSGQGFSSYLHVPGNERSLSNQLVSAVLPDGNQYVWVGTLGGGLNRVRLSDGDTQRIPLNQVGVNFIRVIAEDRLGRLWVGGEALHVFDPKTMQAQALIPKQAFDQGARFTSIAVGAEGEIWAGSSAGLFRISSDGRYRRYRASARVANSFNDDAIDSLLIDRANRLWVGTKGGLYLYDASIDGFRLVGQPTAAVPNIEKLGVTALRQDGSGRIWAATIVGLLEVVPANSDQGLGPSKHEDWKLVNWKGIGGLPDDVIEAMQDAGRDEIWMSTERSVMRLKTSDKSGHYYSSFGRFEGAFNFGAAAKNEEGVVFFGGVGLVSFNPDHVGENKIAPRVILSDIRLFDRSLSSRRKSLTSNQPDHLMGLSDVGIHGSLSVAKEMQLNSSQSMVSFELSSLHFYDHAQNRYAWKLEGYDERWIIGEDDRAMATYTNLDPKKYRLLAKVASPDGVWSEERVLMHVVVHPPYWRTWWWYGLWICLVGSFLAWLYRSRVQRLREHEAYLSQRVKQQTQEIVNQKNRADMQRDIAERARHDIGRLSQVGLQITASLDIKRILDTLYGHIYSMLDATTVGVGFVDWEQRLIHFDYCMQGTNRIVPYSRSLDAMEQPASRCVREERELIIDSMVHDSRRLDSVLSLQLSDTSIVLENGDDSESCQSGIYVPILHGGRAIGVIGVLNVKEHAFSENDLNIIRTLASYVAVAYDNADTYRRLEITRSKLVEQEKMAALGSLVAGVAHELNTPIGNSLLMASTLREVSHEFIVKAKSNQIRRSDLESFCYSTENSADLLVKSLGNAANLVSSFKQIAVDQTSDKRRQFDLRRFCEEVSMTLSNRLKREGHSLSLDIEEGVVLDSYPGSLGQVLSNLIINAVVHGFANKTAGQIEIHGHTVGEHSVLMTVRDNGAGIANDHLPRIFEPFFTTRLGEGGSGLGLHICYNIVVSILGGTIAVESEVGRGSCFVITIPLKAPSRKESE